MGQAAMVREIEEEKAAALRLEFVRALEDVLQKVRTTDDSDFTKLLSSPGPFIGMTTSTKVQDHGEYDIVVNTLIAKKN